MNYEVILKRFSYAIKAFSYLISCFFGCLAILGWETLTGIEDIFGKQISLEQILWTLSNPVDNSDSEIFFQIFLKLIKTILLCTLWGIFVNFLYKDNKNESLLVRVYNLLSKYIYLIQNNRKNHTTSFISKLLLGICLCLSLAGFSSFAINANKRLGITDLIPVYYGSSKNDWMESYYAVPQLSDIYFKQKNNLVITLVESFDSNFSNEQTYTPKMKALYENGKGQGIFRMVNTQGSQWTIGALVGWFFGLPLKLPGGHNSYSKKTGFLPGTLSVFDVLKENGYKTVLIMGGDSHFSNMDSLVKGHGNFDIYDKSYWEKLGYDLKKYGGTGWGYNDNFVLSRASEIYEKLQEYDTPFAILVETIDTHGPLGWCPEDKRQYGDIRDAFLETDRQLAKFINRIHELKTKPMCLAVLGDHLFMGEREIFEKVERHIWNLFFEDCPKIPFSKSNQIVNAVDIAPTILEAAGARWNNRQFGLGYSFFSEEESLVNRLKVKGYNKLIRGYSKKYNDLL